MHRLLAKAPLRLVLIIPFVAQVSAAVGLAAWLSIRNGEKAVHDVAIQLLDDVSTLTRDRIPTFLEIPKQLNTLHANNVELEHIDVTGDVRALSPYLVKSLQVFEPVNFTVFANPQGHYIGARREADGSLQIGVIDEATDDNLQYYSTNERGAFGQLLQEIDLQPGDVLQRPWYKAAVEAQVPTWSEVYTTRSTESLAITATRPLYSDRGSLLGVFSTTIALRQIDQFLESIKIGPSGQVFIVDGAGRLIATSTGERLYRLVNRDGVATKELLQATESQHPLTRAAAKTLLDQAGPLAVLDTAQNFELIANRERDFVKVTPLQEYTALDWRIVVVAPEADFMAQIDANTRNTIWLCLGALALASGSSILTARWITRPLLQLNQAAKAITQGSLESAQSGDAIVTNRTREVSELSHSFSQMTQQLQASFSALQTSEANFRNMAANVPGALFRYTLRPDGTDAVLYMSPGCYQLWEVEAHEVEQDASLLWSVIDPEDLPAMQASVMESAQRLTTWNHEWRITTPSGRRKWLQATGQPIRQPDGSVLWHTVILDVSERKQAEAQLQDVTNRLGLAARSADMGIWEWDMVNDHLVWDEQMFVLYNLCPEDFSNIYTAWQSRVHPDDLPVINAIEQKAWASQQDYAAEFRIIWPDGTIRHMASFALVQRDADGRPLRMVGANLDISDRKQAEEQLIYSALHDTLTDLPNRALLTDQLESSLRRVHRSDTYHFALLFLDLDQFKVINDSLGHLVGDELLMTVAQKLLNIVRPTDLVARLGGDEFVILLEYIADIQAAVHMAERLLAEFEGATVVDDHSVFITTSIGIVWGTNDYTNASDLMRDADIALYRAKASGRGRYAIFDVEMHTQAVKRMICASRSIGRNLPPTISPSSISRPGG